MPKGGARSRSGVPPNPNALYPSVPLGEWTILPAAGRPGPPPDWPLTKATSRELGLWADMWSRPQAIMWERHRQQVEVALYVRRLVEAEVPHSPIVRSTLVRQISDSLGLTTPGLRMNRWRIEDEVPSATVEGHQPGQARSPARDRLKVVSGGSG